MKTEQNHEYVKILIFKYKDIAMSKVHLAELCKLSRPTIQKYCKLYNISIRIKFRWKKPPTGGRYELKDILDGKYPMYPTSKLRIRLIRENIKENICEVCRLPAMWNKLPLILHVHHINGNSSDHKLENLQLLCPNCHSQTVNFGSKNK